MPITSSQSQPIVFSASTEAQVYGLFALAIALTLAGVYAGLVFHIFSSGMLFVLMIASLAIIFTSRLWMERWPLNIFLFALFPFITGLAFTPYLVSILATYVNAGSILLNALGATACTSLAAAVFAFTTRLNLGVLGKTLFFSLIGLLVLGVLQIFVPSFQTGQMELLISGAGVVIFALFTAYDLQRIQRLGKIGANPFLLALSLYLDIFNLFISVLRLLLALSGNRRSY